MQRADDGTSSGFCPCRLWGCQAVTSLSAQSLELVWKVKKIGRRLFGPRTSAVAKIQVRQLEHERTRFDRWTKIVHCDLSKSCRKLNLSARQGRQKKCPAMLEHPGREVMRMTKSPRFKNTRRSTSDATPKDVYQAVTDTILASLEKGIIPWRKPWASTSSNQRPVNAVTGKPYRGINFWLLGLTDFTDHRFVSFKQAQDLGGNVIKGQKGFLIVYYADSVLINEKDADGELTGNKIPVRLLKYSYVFNVEQCEGLNLPELPTVEPKNVNDAIDDAEQVWESYKGKPSLTFGGTSCYYRPSTDSIQMVKRENFDSSESYYHTLFHEAIHSTGHESRLNRKEVVSKVNFGSCDYSKEELVAELGASYLMAEIGMSNDTLENSVAYIASWLQALKNDKTMVIRAAGKASTACEWILGTAEVTA